MFTQPTPERYATDRGFKVEFLMSGIRVTGFATTADARQFTEYLRQRGNYDYEIVDPYGRDIAVRYTHRSVQVFR